MKLDHLFVLVEDGPAAEAAAQAAGLVVTHRRDHIGQGTSNVCFGFRNAYLEFLWVRDEAEVRSEAVRRTRLAERADGGAACPFGVCLRTPNPPFETWRYDAPFPPGLWVEMAVSSGDTAEPLVFAFLAPAEDTPGPQQPIGDLITHVELAFPLPPNPSASRRCLPSVGVSVRDAPVPWLTVTVNHAQAGERIDIREARLTILR